MLKVLGAAMIVTGCLGMGIWYRQQLIHRLYALRNLCRILELLCSEIRYGKATLPECCRHLAGILEEPYAECFRRIFKELQKKNGRSFSEVFCENMNLCMEQLPVKREDREAFLQFVNGGSFADGNMQLRSIEQSRELLADTVDVLKCETAEKGRMAVGLGAMCGLFLVVVLL